MLDAMEELEHERDELKGRVAELESDQQPRPMADAPPRRVLIEDINGEWAICDPSSMPVGMLKRAKGWLPLPAQQTRTNSEAPRLAQFERFARYITMGRDHYHHSRGQCCKGECDGAPQCLVCDAEDLLAGEGAYARPPTASDAPARKETP